MVKNSGDTKKVILILALVAVNNTLFALDTPQTQISQVEKYRVMISRAINEYIKCIKSDRSCNPKKQKIVQGVTGFIALLAMSGAGYLAVRRLLRKKHDMETQDNNVADQFYRDGASSDPDRVRNLLKQGLKPNTPGILFEAVEKGNPEVVKILLDASRKGPWVDALKSHLLGEETPLLYATKKATEFARDIYAFPEEVWPQQGYEKFKKIIQLLVNAGAEINVKNVWGQTPTSVVGDLVDKKNNKPAAPSEADALWAILRR